MELLDKYNREKLPGGAINGGKPLLAQSESRPWLLSAKSQIEHFSRYFTRADLLARRFQRRYLMALRSMYALAPLAVLVAAAQSVFMPDREWLAWIEFFILVVITVLLIVTRSRHWQERWISARYLAEQIRSMTFLGLTGIITFEKQVSPGHHGATDETRWTERAASEIWFARPRYVPPADITLLIEVLCEAWIKDQQKYHVTASESARNRRNRAHYAAIGLFSLSALAALLHSLKVRPTPAQPLKWWDFLAIVFPAVAGALGAYAAQRDYMRHAERSKLFASVLDDGITRLVSTRSLGDVQQAALGISRTMRNEATDWYSVVRSQDPELPS
jgi:hypothetical protein